jgi:hypothetical protein
MISKSHAFEVLSLSLLCASGVGACGNYSNDDVDFELALPNQNDIEAKTQLTVTRADSAEYYIDTQSAITTFNNMATTLLGFIDHVRGYPPSQRNGNERVWGPFPSDQYPAWQFQVVMDRTIVSTSLLHMDYHVDLRLAGQSDSAWVSLLTGSYTSAGSARVGNGDISFLAQAVRAAGYPIDDDPGLVDLDELDVTYQNATYPMTVTMAIQNLPTAQTQSGSYSYSEQQDGSGSMDFTWQGTTDTNVQGSAEMNARWLGSGAGRADLIFTPSPSGAAITLGTDCWGVDTVATYSYRLQNNTTSGTSDSCAF